MSTNDKTDIVIGDPNIEPEVVEGPTFEQGQELVLRGWWWRVKGLFSDGQDTGVFLLPLRPVDRMVNPEREVI